MSKNCLLMRRFLFFLLFVLPLCSPYMTAATIEVTLQSTPATVKKGDPLVLNCLLRNCSNAYLTLPKPRPPFFQLNATTRDGTLVASSPTALLELKPLRVQDVMVIPPNGRFPFSIQAECKALKRVRGQGFAVRVAVAMLSDGVNDFFTPKECYIAVRVFASKADYSPGVKKRQNGCWEGDILSNRKKLLIE